MFAKITTLNMNILYIVYNAFYILCYNLYRKIDHTQCSFLVYYEPEKGD